MSGLRVLDLFSGIGGFSLGLERAGGFQTVGFCEIDPACRQVLAHHWPEVPCDDDVETREFVEGEADIITAGFPCQDISFAGDGAGLTGSRSGLYRHVIRAVRVVRPEIAILENVAALLGRGMGTVLGDLAEVGYDAEWHCIPASAVGAPHRRDRVWIIADAGGEQHESCRAPFSGALAAELSRTDAYADGCERCAQSDSEQAQPEIEASRRSDAQRLCSAGSVGDWWSTEPDVGRVAHGIPARVDRLRALGNAVVPQIPEIIGRVIRTASPSRDGGPA